MMETFEQYSAEMEKFRHTRLANIYPEFLTYLKRSPDFTKSGQLEALFNLWFRNQADCSIRS
jgi:hypothetical protein